ncbi:MAG: PEP-CTERM sorting domain-containing protein, partial [Mariniblastus sp.]|nr:PEP-CTERM sorting domain-containing protein [Mariniblastus sp.]
MLNRPDDETHTPIAQQTIDFPGSTPGGPSFPGAIVYDQGVNQLRVSFRNRKGTLSNHNMFVEDVPVIAMWSYSGGGASDPSSFDMRRSPNAFGQAPGTYDATDWGPLNTQGLVGGGAGVGHTDFIGGETSPGNPREWAALLVYDHVLSEEDQVQVMDFLGNEYGIPSVSSSGPPTDHVWTVDASGSWSSVNNWSFGIIPNSDPNTPNSGSHSATFGSKITAPRTVFTESEITVNRIVFDNANEYVIAGNYPIYLAASTVPADPRIDVASGSHQFQAVVNLLDSTTANTASDSTLEFNNRLFLNGHTLTKTGEGTLAISNDVILAGGTISLMEGTIVGNGTVGGDLVNDGGTISPGNQNIQAISPVPEPATWLLLGVGL